MRFLYNYLVGTIVCAGCLDWSWHQRGDAFYMWGIALVAFVVKVVSSDGGR